MAYYYSENNSENNKENTIFNQKCYVSEENNEIILYKISDTFKHIPLIVVKLDENKQNPKIIHFCTDVQCRVVHYIKDKEYIIIEVSTLQNTREICIRYTFCNKWNIYLQNNGIYF